MSELNFLKTNFVPKYQKLLAGLDYSDCFSENDGWLFYNSLEEVGIIKIVKEARQKEWDRIRSDLSWWKNENRKPRQQEYINKCKSNLFKNWVIGHFELETTAFGIFDLKND